MENNYDRFYMKSKPFFMTLLVLLIILLCFNKSCFAFDRGNDTFSVKILIKELKKYNVKYIDIAVAQFIYETGYLNGSCSDILCLGNNLFAMKKAYVRPNVADGEFSPKGGGKYAYYTNWRRSVLDYALYQSHYINTKTTREKWLIFLDKKYSSTKGYSRKIKQIIKDKKILMYANK